MQVKFLALFLLLNFTVLAAAPSDARLPLNWRYKLAEAPIPFIENQGQFDDAVRFYARTLNGRVFVTQTGQIMYRLPANRLGTGVALTERPVSQRCSLIRGGKPLSTRISFFNGNDSAKWCGAPAFQNVHLGEVCPGVQLELQARGNNVEKLFYVAPEADPAAIKMQLAGATKLQRTEWGELEALTDAGSIKFTRPVAFQEINNQREFVEVAYCVSGNYYGFTVGAYNRQYPLVIDPLLAGTFLGGAGKDGDFYTDVNIAQDPAGNIYVAGSTGSVDFPTSAGIFDIDHNGSVDVFVACFNSTLTEMIAATYLGGSGTDECRAIALDDQGNVFLAGITESSNFPTSTQAYDRLFNGAGSCPYGSGDAFIAKLDADLQTLVASTYVGGISHDCCSGLAWDPNGFIYISGETGSSNFPTTDGAFTGNYQPGGQWGADGYIAKFSDNLRTLVASTLFGGSGDDFPEVLALDAAGNVFVAGWVTSRNFPTTENAVYPAYRGGMYDGFVTGFNSDLTALQASTFVGGSLWDFCYGLCIANSGDIFVTGHTASGNFPTSDGAFLRNYQGAGGQNSGDDVFVTRFDPDLSTVHASTYLGGDAWENGYAILATDNRSVIVSGTTSSGDFPVTSNAVDTTYGGGSRYIGDVFLSKFDFNLTTLQASTYLGGSTTEGLGALLLDDAGNLYVAGSSASPEFPVSTNAYDARHNGNSDVFVVAIDTLLSQASILPDFGAEPTRGHAPLTVSFVDRSVSPDSLTHWSWDFENDGVIDAETRNPVWTFETPGIYDVSLKVSSPTSLNQIVWRELIQVFDGESALDFDREKSIASCPAGEHLNLTTALTAEAWIFPRSWGTFAMGGFGRILDKGSFSLFLIGSRANYNEKCLAFESTHANGKCLSMTPNQSISLNEWQHVAVTFADSTVRIFINGTEQILTQTRQPSGALVDHADTPLCLGNASSLRYGFNGGIDEVRLWNCVLSPQEIEMTRQQYATGRERGLAGYWKLNEGSGASIADETGQAESGILTDVYWMQGVHHEPATAIHRLAAKISPAAGCWLGANYPNPFNPVTQIRFHLEKPGKVTVQIFDIHGRRVQTLISQSLASGMHTVRWNGRDSMGRTVSSGEYLYQLKTADFQTTRKMLLVK